MDLRKEIDNLLIDFGYPVILQRTSRKIRCRCFSEIYQEAKSRCPLCHGTGWVVWLERHRTMRDDAVLQTSKPNLNQHTRVGHLWIPANTFYLRHTAHPKVGDIIYEVGWRERAPSHLVQAHEINHLFTERGDNGRIEFHLVATKTINVNKDFMNSVILNASRIRNHDIKR